ncbi:MAG: helix-turn-helix transcriptional regulator [Alphaproteobacteria bacterium]|nr:helix-turn-helix transcriptional regulator [Alphaproteobacteria bacterium]
MITTAQIRGARGILGWSQGDLAERTGISATSIGSIENGITQARTSTLEIIRNVFERAGIEFLGLDGLRKQNDFIKTYSGASGLSDFMDHLYKVCSTIGGEVVLFNAKPSNWIKWLGNDWMQMHSDRMEKIITNVSYKIATKYGETQLISKKFAEYRWFPEHMLTDRAMYAYGDYLALVNFDNNDLSVVVINQSEFSQAFKVLFNIAWESFGKKIDDEGR